MYQGLGNGWLAACPGFPSLSGWRADPDVQNEMRNAIDDLLYEAKAKQGVPLTAQDMDAIIERALDLAKNRDAK